MTGPYRVLLIADQKWRDLPGLAAVKVWLEDRFGVSVAIFPFSGFEAGMFLVRPHAVVLNHMNGWKNQSIARIVRKMGSRVIVIPNEGRPQNNDFMKYVTGQLGALSLVDLWLTWSDTVREAMVQRRAMPTDSVKMTGTPRFDFYVEPLRSIIMSRTDFLKKHGLIPGRPNVCWATNFVLARHVRTNTLDFLVDDFRNLGISQIPGYSNPVHLAKRDLEVRLQTLNILKRLCGRFRQVNFILKPHPHEEIGDYEAFVLGCRAEGLDNIALVTEEYIWDVLNAVDIHIHRLCTTGIEAWLMGVPSINFHMTSYGAWTLKVEGPGKEALAGDDLVTEENSLADRIEFYLQGGQMDPNRLASQKNYIQRWFYRLDGLAAFRCAEQIASHLATSRPNPKFKMSLLGPRAIAKIFINRSLGRPLDTPIRTRIKYHNGVPVDFLGQRDKSVQPNDVNAWASKIREVLRTGESRSQAHASHALD